MEGYGVYERIACFITTSSIYALNCGGRKEDKKGERGMEERDEGKVNRGDGKGTSTCTCRYDIHLKFLKLHWIPKSGPMLLC